MEVDHSQAIQKGSILGGMERGARSLGHKTKNKYKILLPYSTKMMQIAAKTQQNGPF